MVYPMQKAVFASFHCYNKTALPVDISWLVEGAP